MSSLSQADMTRVAHQAVREDAPGYEVVGVKVNDSDGDYTEVILRVRDCDHNPCVVTIGVFRDADESALRKAITEKLQPRHDHG